MRIIMIAATLCLAATASQAGTVDFAAQPHETAYPIVRVADGCGPGFHVSPRGICRPNGERVVIERPAVVVPARPVVVEQPVVVERRAPVVEEVVVRRPSVPTCGVRVGPIAVRGVC